MPMQLDDTARCPARRSRITPVMPAPECLQCSRWPGYGYAAQPGDINPTAAYVQPTAHAGGYCKERRYGHGVASVRANPNCTKTATLGASNGGAMSATAQTGEV